MEIFSRQNVRLRVSCWLHAKNFVAIPVATSMIHPRSYIFDVCTQLTCWSIDRFIILYVFIFDVIKVSQT